MEIDDEWTELAKQYIKQFGEKPPLMMMPQEAEEQIEIMRQALESGCAFEVDTSDGKVY